MNAQHIDFLQLLNGNVQYVIPRWQRRYCWGQSDIERLVEDLLLIADADTPGAAHYGGTMLTFQEPGAAGVVTSTRVVDGQQRLTTVSILLACIAARLGPEGRCGEWTAKIIRNSRLTNQDAAQDKRRKLRLQGQDEEEYRLGLDGRPAGSGAVTQAWKIARRLVERFDTGKLLRGLERFRVVSIGLDDREDPQQIFESLNATGRPLTESEKVKNWLLMGLPEALQQKLHDTHWKQIEQCLGAEHATARIDMFLRDLLRWRTGHVHRIDHVYEGLRRWAVRELAGDREQVCGELDRLAGLYGFLTGTRDKHPDRKVEQALQHLRAMKIDTHRPLTLRLLNDAADGSEGGVTTQGLAKALEGIGVWITRLWLADRLAPGMNKAMTELAAGPGPGEGDDFAEYWIGRIHKFRNTRLVVPGDEEVAEGVMTRRAYGGSATKTTFAVLCAMMEADQVDRPQRHQLTVEHIMPQKLTDDWKQYLGDDASEIHSRWRDRFANLTLSGKTVNPSLGAKLFAEKKKTYLKSGVLMTNGVGKESGWDEKALDRRAIDLVRRALQLWPWQDTEGHESQPTYRSAPLAWRIDEGVWHSERKGSAMMLNVARALLDHDPNNAQRLSGDAISTNVHPASRYPADTKAESLMMRAVPGHKDYVMCPYAPVQDCVRICRAMGARCNVSIDVEFRDKYEFTKKFWRCLKEQTGGVPGQNDKWIGAVQWTKPLNRVGDYIGIQVADQERIVLSIKAGKRVNPEATAERLRQYSWMIQDEMSDQMLGDDMEENIRKGWTITVQRPWAPDDEDQWPEATRWLKAQQERLQTIVERHAAAAEDLTATEARP